MLEGYELGIALLLILLAIVCAVIFYINFNYVKDRDGYYVGYAKLSGSKRIPPAKNRDYLADDIQLVLVNDVKSKINGEIQPSARSSAVLREAISLGVLDDMPSESHFDQFGRTIETSRPR